MNVNPSQIMKKYVVISFDKYSRLMNANAETNEESNSNTLLNPIQDLKCANASELTEPNTKDIDHNENNENIGVNDLILEQKGAGDKIIVENQTEYNPPPGLPPKENKVITVFKPTNNSKLKSIPSEKNWKLLWKKY